MSEYCIGIDVGGTNIRVGIIGKNLELIKKDTISTNSFNSAPDMLSEIKKMVDSINSEGLAKKIGIALPIPWKNGSENIYDATNIPFLEQATISQIKSYFPMYDVYFENDVNVIAILESEQGAAKDTNDSMYITVSTGIGSGIILNNAICQGGHGYAGEVGSMIIADGKTLEDICSGKALEEKSKLLFGDNATAGLLFKKYNEGDKNAVETIEKWCEHFSIALASLMCILNPSIFILGGAVISNNPWLIDSIVDRSKDKVFQNLKDKIKIARPQFGDDAGIIGAAYICLTKI